MWSNDTEQKEEKPVIVASNFQGGAAVSRCGGVARNSSFGNNPEKVQYFCESEALKRLNGHPHIVQMVSHKNGVLVLGILSQWRSV